MRVFAILSLCALVGGCHRIWPYDQTQPAGSDGPAADAPTVVDGLSGDGPPVDVNVPPPTDATQPPDGLPKTDGATPCPLLCAGCCKPDGTCVSVTTQDTSWCGKNGEDCKTCGTGQMCQAGTCVAGACGPGSCNGCCDIFGKCATPSNIACGSNGSPCVVCVAGQQCTGGVCKCTAASCPLGCCDPNEKCITGLGPLLHTVCGIGGVPCDNCVSKNQYCSVLTNKCTSPSCGLCSGCCNESNVCVTNTNNAECGKYGETCLNCSSKGDICCDGVCEYGPCTS